jgi:WD40 repeat protein
LKIETPGRNIRTVRFNNEGSALAIGYYDGYLELREIPGNTILSQVNAHSSVINAIRFSSNLRQMATASNDKTVKIWNLADMTLPPVVFRENNQFAMRIEFSPDGRYIVIGNYDGTNNLTWHATEADFLADEVRSMLTRNLTPEEWSLYIGRDVEYEKIILK